MIPRGGSNTQINIYGEAELYYDSFWGARQRRGKPRKREGQVPIYINNGILNSRFQK